MFGGGEEDVGGGGGVGEFGKRTFVPLGCPAVGLGRLIEVVSGGGGDGGMEEMMK